MASLTSLLSEICDIRSSCTEMSKWRQQLNSQLSNEFARASAVQTCLRNTANHPKTCNVHLYSSFLMDGRTAQPKKKHHMAVSISLARPHLQPTNHTITGIRMDWQYWQDWQDWQDSLSGCDRDGVYASSRRSRRSQSEWKLQWMKDLENTTPSCYALLLADNDGDMTVLRLVLVPAYPRAEANATMVTTFS